MSTLSRWFSSTADTRVVNRWSARQLVLVLQWTCAAACFNSRAAAGRTSSFSQPAAAAVISVFQRRADSVSVRRAAADRPRRSSCHVPLVSESGRTVGWQRACDSRPRHRGIPPGQVPRASCRLISSPRCCIGYCHHLRQWQVPRAVLAARGTQLRRRQPRQSAAALVPRSLRRGREDTRSTAW